ncbi:mitochondrial thiamine pyrophosphate transporter [Geranomyces variabilis]|uniref:Mitochondrial thiamine pyrophosphate transporter n=1 Tax=Geranomyces variabilis TaxID=109894 RepID=A0AAD5XRS2_9FUNG|nr:mitochondrial thiamine pyrophosphate transporter [Geranomyces variabilis]
MPTGTVTVGESPAPPPLAPWKNALAGASGGVVSRVVIAPLDVIKIRLQLQTDVRQLAARVDPSAAKYTGVVQACSRILREEGYRGLWKGNLSAEYLYLTYGAVQFYTYHEYSALLHRISSSLPIALPTELFAGALAGCTATVATYPFDLLRTRFAMQGASGGPYTSLLSAVRQIYAAEGVHGFYRGVVPSVLQMAPQMGIVFAAYGGIKRLLKPLKLGKTESFISGGIAGMLGKLSVMPFDVVRKRLQVQGPERNSYVTGRVPKYPSGLLRCAAQIARQEGWLALYKGVVPALLKAGPSSAVTFAVVRIVSGALE